MAYGLAPLTAAVRKRKVASVAKPVTPAPVAPATGTDVVFGNTVPKAPVQTGATSFTPEGFMNAYANAYNAANAANEARYGDILSGYKGLYNSYRDAGNQANQDYYDRYQRGMTYLNNAGAQEASDVRKSWSDQQAKAAAQLQGMGMSGTTVAPTMAMGMQREANADLSRLHERLQNQRMAADASLSGDYLQNRDRYTAGGSDIMQNALNFKERRTDQLPDMGTYAQLALRAGEAGFGAGNGGAGGAGGGAGAAGAGGYGAAAGAMQAAPSNIYMDTTGKYMYQKLANGQMQRIPYIQGASIDGYYNGAYGWR